VFRNSTIFIQVILVKFKRFFYVTIYDNVTWQRSIISTAHFWLQQNSITVALTHLIMKWKAKKTCITLGHIYVWLSVWTFWWSSFSLQVFGFGTTIQKLQIHWTSLINYYRWCLSKHCVYHMHKFTWRFDI
jgi:hypothetical protein